METKSNMRAISGKVIVIQSCWLDRELDIVANLGIGQNGKLLHSRHILIVGRAITYPYFVPYLQSGPRMIFQEFDAFLNANAGALLDLVVSLLEPDEVNSLRKGVDSL